MLIWIIILGLGILTWRAQSAAVILARKAADSATMEDIRAVNQLAETARQYIVEWGTWNGDAAEYERRLKAFNPELPIYTPAGAVTRVTSAQTVDVRKEEQHYIATVVAHQQRYVPLDNDSRLLVPEPYQRSGKPASWTGLEPTPGETSSGWVDAVFTVHVALAPAVGEKAAVVLSPPVVAADWQAPAVKLSGECDARPSPDTVTVLTNFLRAYYGSRNPADLSNYLAPEGGITPVGGWELRSLDAARVDTSNSPTRADVRITVAQGGVEMVQRLRLELEVRDGRLLVRAVSPVY